MPRRRLIMLAAAAFFATFGFTFLFARADSGLRKAREAIGIMEACGALRLGMTRDDVLRVMGAPAREYQTEGPSGGPATAIRFHLPLKEDRFPIVILERDRLVEAACTEDQRLSASPEEINAMFAREEAQQSVIRSDSTRR